MLNVKCHMSSRCDCACATSLSSLFYLYSIIIIYIIIYILIYIIYLYIFNYIFRPREVRWCMHMHNCIDLTCDIWHFSLQTGASFLQTGVTEAVDQSSLKTGVSLHLCLGPVITYDRHLPSVRSKNLMRYNVTLNGLLRNGHFRNSGFATAKISIIFSSEKGV